jgi:hypothetical protein
LQVKLAVLADYANVTADGKLNILGTFDRINLVQMPAMHPQMYLVLRIEAQAVERDRSHKIEIRLHDPEGQTIFDVNGDLVPHGEGPHPTSTNQILTLNNLQLEKVGAYNFVIFINNDLKLELPLHVEFVTMPPVAGAQPSQQFH